MAASEVVVPEVPETVEEEKPEVVVIPEKVAKPSKEKHDEKLSNFNRKIDELTKARDKIEQQIKLKLDSGKGTRNERAAALDKVKKLKAQRRSLIEERKVMVNKRAMLSKKMDDHRDAGKKLRESFKYSKVEDIDDAIARLNRKQATTSLSITQEKKLLKDISELKASRVAVEDYQRHMAGGSDWKTGMKEIREMIVAKSEEINGFDVTVKAAEAILDKLSAMTKVVREEEIPQMFEKKNSIKKELDAVYTAMKAERAAYKELNNKFWLYNKYINAERYKKREEERAKAQAEYEAEQAKIQAELDAMKPWLKEIAMCESLVRYCEGLIPKSATKAKAVVKVGGKKAREDDDFMSGMVKSKKFRKRNKKKKGKVLLHSGDALDEFSFLKIVPPADTNDIENVIKELKAKKDYFDTLPKSAKPHGEKKTEEKKTKPKKAKKSALKERVTTPYGSGEVDESRTDGVTVVKLDWVVADGTNVVAYMQSSDLKADLF